MNAARPNDIIRFMLLGNGFYDPYSAYIRMEVTYDPENFIDANIPNGSFAGKFLDRSAHSIIGRLVIRS